MAALPFLVMGLESPPRPGSFLNSKVYKNRCRLNDLAAFVYHLGLSNCCSSCLLFCFLSRCFSHFAALGLCDILVCHSLCDWEFSLFWCQFLGLETRLQDFAMSAKSTYTILSLVVLVISPIYTTCDLNPFLVQHPLAWYSSKFLTQTERIK